MDARPGPLRVAALGDLHCTKATHAIVQALVPQLAAAADIVVVCGDFTDYGLADEARAFARDFIAALKIPVVAVLGNHDFEAGQVAEIKEVLIDAGAHVLDGDACEIHGVGFAGVKGFAGGFGPRALGPWGEPIIKQFVHEAVDEALKLEAALARLRTPYTIAVLHYSPIVDTVEGEPLEIYPFLGCSRLEEPLLRYPVTAVFHGHAHRGREEGRTKSGIPVYNVSLPLLSRLYPDRPPFRILELPGLTPDRRRSEAPAGELTRA